METWYETQLDDLQGLITKIRSDLTSLQRKCVVALVTTDVHARDIVEDLKNKGVCRVDDFNWMQQLRYYWESVGADSASVTQHWAKLNFASMAPMRLSDTVTPSTRLPERLHVV